MTHGAPDNYEVQQKSTVFRLDDMAELAVRQGAISSIDRLGDVILSEGFENGLTRHNILGSGTDYSASISGKYARSGGFSCKLVAGKTVNVYSRINMVTFFPILSNVGYEISTLLYEVIDYILLGLNIRDGSFLYQAYFAFDLTKDEISIMDEHNNFIPIIKPAGLYDSRIHWYTAKIVVNLTNKTYRRLRFKNLTYDLSEYPLKKGAATTSVSLTISAENRGFVTSNLVAYIDDIIITQNEP